MVTNVTDHSMVFGYGRGKTIFQTRSLREITRGILISYVDLI